MLEQENTKEDPKGTREDAKEDVPTREAVDTEYVYTLNTKTRKIHSAPQPCMGVVRIKEADRVDVQGLNWHNVDVQDWTFCGQCFEEPPQRP